MGAISLMNFSLHRVNNCQVELFCLPHYGHVQVKPRPVYFPLAGGKILRDENLLWK